MSIMRPLAVATLSAAIASPALAQESTDQKLYLNPFVAYQLFDHKRELSETGTFGGGLEYRFQPNWAAELVYSRADADRKNNPGSSDFDEIRLDGLYYFGDFNEAWNPYLAAGAGHADFGGSIPDPQTSGTDHDETRVNVGGGVRYNVSDNISLRADIREFHGIDESTFDTVASLGFSIGFGHSTTPPAPEDSDDDGVPDNRDQCPGTAAGVSVDSNGCELDGDNDGVADSRDQCPDTPAGAEVNSRGCELDSDKDGVVNSKDRCPNTAAGVEVDDEGCEGIEETVETIELSVKFPLESAVIGNTYDEEIRQVADFMNEYPETSVEIAGHSDSTGKAEYNQKLSQERARAVADRLVDALGIDSDRVRAVGYGESEPMASNETDAGRAQNRRVEARIQVRR
ncbi:MAG: OmpA family protein [Marinobacter sp.]|uniref:OmpA family protein n=1 Tax=Marinobacter sp. TaxID=50741 RepID=UPI0034A01E46